jgi:sodium-dependent dicarboxylate transporter 2/3/5
LVGTPPNALVAAYAHETLGRTIGFVEWMAVGLPVAIALLPAAWVWLALIAFPVRGAHRGVVTARQNRPLAPLGHPAIMVAAVFTLTALLWVTRPLYQNVIPGWRIGDTEIALFGALLLFLLPSGRLGSPPLLDWSAAKSLPWGTLILFGGGLALAGAIETSGLAAWLGRGFATLEGVSPLVLVLALSAVIIALSELASNTAVAAIFLPIIGAAAIGLGSDPVGLAAPAILASSLAFMMPVGTPPNAIIYGTGHVTIGQMARAGLVLNLLGVAAIVFIGYPIARLVLAE